MTFGRFARLAHLPVREQEQLVELARYRLSRQPGFTKRWAVIFILGFASAIVGALLLSLWLPLGFIKSLGVGLIAGASIAVAVHTWKRAIDRELESVLGSNKTPTDHVIAEQISGKPPARH